MPFYAPIDHQIAYHDAMSTAMSQQSGDASGAMIPMSKASTAPTGMAPQIHMKVNPHGAKSLIKHSLASAVLK